MAISYPLSPPNNWPPSSVVWRANNVIATSISPFSLAQHTVEHDGSAWTIDVAIDPMDRRDAAPWMAFLAALKGRRGTFYFGDALMKNSLGSPSGTPRVKGSSQTGNTIATDGWTAETTVLKAGDFIQINNSLYMVLSDVTSDGSGNASIDLWPNLRVHADDS